MTKEHKIIIEDEIECASPTCYAKEVDPLYMGLNSENEVYSTQTEKAKDTLKDGIKAKE